MSDHHVAGGRARAAALTAERRAEIARAAADARWAKQKPASGVERDWLLVASPGRRVRFSRGLRQISGNG